MPRGKTNCFYCGKLVPSIYKKWHEIHCHSNPESPYNKERRIQGLEPKRDRAEGPLDKYLESKEMNENAEI